MFRVAFISSLNIVSESSATMSDSDEEECPELVEEVLGKVTRIKIERK